MSTKNQKSETEKNLDKLKADAEKARTAASAANEKAAKEGATAEDKQKAVELEARAQELETARGEAQTAFDNEVEQRDQDEAAARQQQATESLKPAEPGVAAAPEKAAAVEDPEDDPKYVPVFRDEDGERIPRNSLIRVQTTTNRNLRALDGTLITPDATVELRGPDIRKGDWYTVQLAAKLIEVVSVRKLK